MKVVGIDPGWSGGLAVITPQAAGCHKFTKLTETDILDVLEEYLSGADACYLELVHSMKGQGVSSTFKFGKIYGLLWGIVLSARVPLYHVTPQRWQKSLNCLTKGDKNVSKRRAQELFPHLKVTHATADALLIAQYGYEERSNGYGSMFKM